MKPVIHNLEGIIPDLEGIGGKAWRVPLAAYRANAGFNPADATIGAWIVHCPAAHPMWSNYMVAAIHLRPIPGAPPPRIANPDATHEIMVYALDPDHTPTLTRPARFLTPANFHGQWAAGTDLAASETLDRTAQEIVDGKLNPDIDGRRQWVQRFGHWNLKPGSY